MPDPNFILDAHLDIAYHTLCFNRAWTTSVYKQRQLESGLPVEEVEGIRVAALPEALLGRVGITFGTIFTCPYKEGGQFSNEAVAYRTPEEAYQKGIAQIDVYQRLADEHPNIRLIRTQRELQTVLDSWQAGVSFENHLFGIVLLMEGGDPILEPKQFEEWYERGVRIVGPAWGATRYSGGTGTPGPFTPLGRELLTVMKSFNAILDLSHLSEDAAYEALDRYEGVMIASHSNARRFHQSDRHLTNQAIRRLAERGGVIGIPMYNRFLKEGWLRSTGSKKEEVTVATHVMAAIDHICQLTGSSDHVGIGSDLDGGFGLRSVPAEIDTISDLQVIPDLMAKRGYSPTDIYAVQSMNFLRVLRATLPT
jgi:membrane dipeptidase